MDQKKYYSGLDAIDESPESKAAQNKEFQEDPFEAAVSGNISASRRDFLKIMGFSVGTAATLAACTKTPVKYALPYVDKPHEIIPTIPNFYATTYFDGEQYESLLVKTREGRPIKIEGNSSSPITRGGTSARSQASVLSLYDTNRLKQPLVNKKATTWSAVDGQLGGELKNASSIRIITPTIISPSTQRLFDEFSEAFPKAKFVTYDAMSYSGILEANDKTFGKRAIPAYRFDQANIIVSFNADFMGTWLSPVEFSAQWAKTRNYGDDNKRMSRHYQFETILSLTGSNADTRIPMKPSHEGAFILKLHSLITGRGSGGMEAPGNMLAAVAAELQANRGKSIVVSGSNDPNVQMLVNEINSVLGNYGTTIDLANHCNLRKGVDSEMNTFVQELEGGQVGAVIFYDVNPVYTHPLGKKLAAAIKNVRVSVFYGTSLNETGALCGYQLPEPHYLESWGDAEPYRGQFSIQQPTINPLFDSRPFQASLLIWLGDKRLYHDYIKDNWKNGPLKGLKDSEDAWKTFVHDGVYAAAGVTMAAPKAADATDVPADKTENKGDEKVNTPVMVGGQPKLMEDAVAAAASKVQSAYDGKLGKLEIVVYEKVGLGAGKDGHNPLIQEFPDPISRVTWDNYVCISKFLAEKEGIGNEDLVEVTANGHTVTLPALIQPGQHKETIAIATGYGRTETGPANKDVGGNAFPLQRSLMAM
jgi:MoCo/4Fe-4S cofactor protein with predicted Tat translocation signal